MITMSITIGGISTALISVIRLINNIVQYNYK